MAYYRSGGGEKVAVGTVTVSTSSQTTVNLGFEPKYLAYRTGSGTSGKFQICIYDERYSTSSAQRSSSSGLADTALGSSYSNALYSINSNGFTVNKYASAYLLSYFAIG